MTDTWVDNDNMTLPPQKSFENMRHRVRSMKSEKTASFKLQPVDADDEVGVLRRRRIKLGMPLMMVLFVVGLLKTPDVLDARNMSVVISNSHGDVRRSDPPAPTRNARELHRISGTSTDESESSTSTSTGRQLPYYLKGKTEYRDVEYDSRRTYRRLEEITASPVGNNETTWILADKLKNSVRNHDSIIIEHDGKQTLVNVLGRYSRAVGWMDLDTGVQHDHVTTGNDPDGNPLNNLNHVNMVLVDSLDGKSKEIWLPCGFHGDRINHEYSSTYARVVDLATMSVRVGPKLPFAGGACVAYALEVDGPKTPPHICSFGGTDGEHDGGTFLPYASCYDRVRQKWHHPFGKLPYGFDHGNIALIPEKTCGSDDPARLLIYNYRTRPYGTPHNEILAFDMPASGWTQEQLAATDPRKPGAWYLYSNVTYEGPEDELNAPRDASGSLVADGGRHILNFGGSHYSYDDPNDQRPWLRKTRRYSIVRMYDVCKKKWKKVADLGLRTFALQTCASADLNLAFTCGGYAWKVNRKENSPWCFVNRIPGVRLENKIAATTNFPKNFQLGGML